MKVKYLIIGAGISGLAFADHITSNDYLICESNNEIGGYCRTISQDGFTWDFSGHFFHFRNEEIKKYLIDRMESQQIFDLVKASKIYWPSNLIDFPFQKNIHQLPKEEFIDCIYDLFDRSHQIPTNFKEMLYSKFGKSISEKFLIPYNEKLYATDLNTLSTNAMGRFFPYANIDEIIKNFRKKDNSSYNDRFTYPEGGAIQYVKALAKKVDPKKISLNEKVLNINIKSKVATTNVRSISYEQIISTTSFVKLLEMSSLPVNANTYSWNKVLVFNLGFDSKGPNNIHWIYFPQKEISFYRVGFYDNILSTDRMSLYVEIGLNKDSKISNQDIEGYRNSVLRDLKSCGIITSQNLISTHSVVMDPAYVHITQESLEDVAQKKKSLSHQGIHSIGRYGSWTYCSIEDNIVEARSLADTFNTIENLS